MVAFLLLATIGIFGQAPVASAPVEKYRLTVKFLGDTPEISADVTIDQPFDQLVKGEKGGFRYIGGVVLPPVGQSYSVVLTTVEYSSEKSNVMGTSKESYELGKPYMSGSNISGRTITLTRIEPPKKP